jgi:Icc-related predicted phosphoesterase
MSQIEKRIRVAAVADLHCSKTNLVDLRPLFASASAEADVLLLCGDLVDHGLLDEARLLAREIAVSVRIPAVGVLGNHDMEAGQQEQIAAVLEEVGVNILDGESCEIEGVGFAGIKGFAGGFGRHALGAWGEDIIKAFVHEAVNEALKLEAALMHLPVACRVALLHYAPIAATVAGEPQEIFPFLGSSRLEEPLNRYPVAAVFHGHAHAGSLEGRTSTGVPVYNVALPLLQHASPTKIPVRIVEITACETVQAPRDGANARG